MEANPQNVPAKNSLGFPYATAPSEQKATYDYGLAYAKAIWAKHQVYLSNYTEQINRFILNRKYAEGLQSVEKYKNQWGMEDTSYLNLDFTPVAIIPKFVNNIVGVLTDNNYKISCEVLNSTSQVAQDDFKNKLNANMLLKPLHDQVAPKTGIPLVAPGSFVPKDQEELSIYMQQNFKPAEALAMQLAIKHVFDSNDFSDIEKMCIRDLIVLKIAAIRRYYDLNNEICIEYIDPVDLMYPYSKYDDFKNIPWVGVNKKMTIQEISEATDEFNEEDLYNIAKQYEGANYGNRPWNYGVSYAGYYATQGILSGRAYDDFNINVLEFEFLGIDPMNWEKKKNKTNGATYFNKKSADYEAQDTKNYTKEIVTKTVTNRYEGKWIIGSKYLYGYKKANNIPREKIGDTYSTKAELQIKIVSPNIYDMQNKSLVEAMIPHADQLQLIRLKIQQIIMKMLPAGFSIDFDAVENVMVGAGGKTMDATDVIKLFTQTGSMVYRRTRVDGREINGKPIEFNPGGLPDGFDLLLQAYNAEINNIYTVTGYNPAAAGQAGEDALVGVGEQQMQATSNTLKPITDSYLKIVTRVAKETSLMIQDKLQYGNGLEGFERAIGKETVEIIQAAKNIPLCEFGIKVVYKPTAQDLASLNNKIQIALKEQTIDIGDAAQVEDQAKEDIKLAIQLLVYLKKQNQKNKMQEAQMNSQMNTQGQVQSAQAAEQSKQQTINVEIHGKAQLMQLEYSLKDQNDEKAHKRRLQELLLVNDAKTNAIKLEHDSEILKMSFDKATDTQAQPQQQQA